MASTSGFQEGGREVARKHNITLIHVTDSNDDVDLALFRARWTGTTEAAHIQIITLEYADGKKTSLSEAANDDVLRQTHPQMWI